MKHAGYRPEITETFESVREFSFHEKKETAIDEKKINNFLDKIIELKKNISLKTAKINHVVEKIEAVTWFNDPDDETLKLINDLISAIRDLYSTLFRQYFSMKGIRSKGIATEETKSFKNSIDDLKEVANDLESIFFFLPHLPDFKETTRQLSLV